jgi:hypothetical protein
MEACFSGSGNYRTNVALPGLQENMRTAVQVWNVECGMWNVDLNWHPQFSMGSTIGL